MKGLLKSYNRKKTDDIADDDEIQFPVYDEAEFFGEELGSLSSIINFAKEDSQFMHLFLASILNEDEIFTQLENHFYDWFGGNGLLKTFH